MAGRRRVLGVANGRTDAGIVIVGLAPGRLGAERTGVPFSGDRSGAMLDSLLARVHLTDAMSSSPTPSSATRRTPPAATPRQRPPSCGAAAITSPPPSPPSTRR
jgi:uracil-DNA glycosylase family 4